MHVYAISMRINLDYTPRLLTEITQFHKLDTIIEQRVKLLWKRSLEI